MLVTDKSQHWSCLQASANISLWDLRFSLVALIEALHLENQQNRIHYEVYCDGIGGCRKVPISAILFVNSTWWEEKWLVGGCLPDHPLVLFPIVSILRCWCSLLWTLLLSSAMGLCFYNAVLIYCRAYQTSHLNYWRKKWHSGTRVIRFQQYQPDLPVQGE